MGAKNGLINGSIISKNQVSLQAKRAVILWLKKVLFYRKTTIVSKRYVTIHERDAKAFQVEVHILLLRLSNRSGWVG